MMSEMPRLIKRLFSRPRKNSLPSDSVTEVDLRMMRRALALAAEAAQSGEVPVGAVIYRGEKDEAEILAEAANNRESASDPTGHAELIAIRLAAERLGDWRLNECTLVVTLEPCVMCAGAIVNARVGRLIYGAADPKAGAVTSLYHLCEDERLNHRLHPVGGVLAEESGKLLRDFFRARRRSGK